MAQAILHLSRVDYLGGAERVTITLLAGLQSHGYAPVLACPTHGELARAARAKNIAIAPCPFSRLRITSNPLILGQYPLHLATGARAVMKHCRNYNIRLIHAHHPVGALYSLPALAFLKLPLVLHVHDGLPLRPLYARALRLACRFASKIICVSSAALDLLSAAGIRRQAEIIPNGIAPEFFSPKHAPTAQVRGEGPHIGVFGTLEPRKGQDVFLTAAGILAREHPRAEFWIVGAPALADKAVYLRRLERLAHVPALAGKVHFVGHQNEIAGWMQAMDVVALPSLSHETLGMALLEAMAVGRPVVASRLAGVTEAIRDGDTGRLVTPGHAGSLADGIAGALGEAARRMAARAALDVRLRFSPNDFCNRIADVYREVIANHPRSGAWRSRCSH